MWYALQRSANQPITLLYYRHAMARNHLYLVGYRGSGKTTVGRILADRLSLPFVDTDEEVEQRTGRTIPELFESLGESGFRELETSAIRSVSVRESSVISLGGGAILRPENREILKGTGFTVWLQATAEQLAARLTEDEAQGKRRPSLTSLGTLGEIATVLKQREPLYRESSDLILQSANSSAIELASQIADWFQFQRG
ncbi:MAG: shikimate kinase [Pirellula sp.]